MQPDRDALLRAVTVLVEAPDASYLYEALNNAIPVARVQPIQLAGDAAVLNPILTLALHDEPAYGRVLALVDTKRAERGRELLVRPDLNRHAQYEPRD